MVPACVSLSAGEDPTWTARSADLLYIQEQGTDDDQPGVGCEMPSEPRLDPRRGGGPGMRELPSLLAEEQKMLEAMTHHKG